MPNKREIQDRAKALKDSAPQESYLLYKQIWDEYQDEFNHYDAFGLIQAARKCDATDYQLILEVLNTFHEEERVNSIAAWYFFDEFIKRKEAHEIIGNQHQIKVFLGLLRQKNLREDDTYPCAYTISIFMIVEAFSKNRFNAEKVNEVLDLLDPKILSKKPKIFPHETRGDIEQASDYEKYYALKTKALLKMEQFEECKLLCEKGLYEIDRFHYDNDLWLKMRKALCLEHLGHLDQSEELFMELLQSRKGSDKWFLYRDLAELYFEQERFEKAFEYSLEAALHGNEPKYLIKLYLLQARILFKLGRAEDGRICAELIGAVIRDNEWGEKEDYRKLFNYYRINLEDVRLLKVIHKEAMDFWTHEKYHSKPKLEGQITQIHSNGKSGFITDLSGRRYFFGKRDLIKPAKNLDPLFDAIVTFYEGVPSDKGKKAEAVEILELAKNDLTELVGKSDTGVITKVNEFGVFVGEIFGDKYGLIHRNKLDGDYQRVYKNQQPLRVVVSKVTSKGIDLDLI